MFTLFPFPDSAYRASRDGFLVHPVYAYVDRASCSTGVVRHWLFVQHSQPAIRNPHPTTTTTTTKMKRNKKALRNAAIATDRENFAKGILEEYQAGDLKVKRTSSGLGYIIHEAADGDVPKHGKQVGVHYLGMLVMDGSIFDESFSRGQSISFRLGLGQVIDGWDEGIDLLTVGDRATFFIPPKLGYGSAGAGADIPPNSELLFYVELVHADR
jgi:FKBP-type peptidyl-prolyl cis-trans isomerase